MRPRLSILIALVAAGVPSSPASGTAAEIFVLKSGGQVRGEWLNRDQSPGQSFVIKTDIGAEITLDRDQVERVIVQSAEEIEYANIRPTYADTVEGHAALAQWCLDKGLVGERRTHLERIIELEPDNAEARTALGFRQVSGTWMTRDEEMAARGLKRFEGRYRTVQEIEILERGKKQKQAELQWQLKVKQWLSSLGTNKAESAIEQLRSIRDPMAVGALAEQLDEQQHRQVKLLLVEVLSQIDSLAAMEALVHRSLRDTDREVRLTALDHVEKMKHPRAMALYIEALKSKDNLEVNRAALALNSLAHPDAISPLIDALVTTHKYKVVTGTAGQTSATFSPQGGGGMSFGGGGAKIISRPVNNPQVLNALIGLSGGMNFDYDVQSWKYWYAREKKSLPVDARRD